MKKTLLITLLILLALYALAGFFLVPAILKPKLIAAIEETTHRSVQVGSVSTNPFALSLSIEDFMLKDRDSSVMVSFKELYVNYEIRSLFSDATVLSAFRLDTPFVAIRIMPDGKPSFQDLLKGGTPDTTVADTSHSPLVIDDFYLAQGTIQYQDMARPSPLTRLIDSLDLSLRNFTTVPRESGEYEFEATTRHGERLHWHGNMSVTPLRSSGQLEISNARVVNLWEFMSDRLKFGVRSGTLNFRGKYDLDLSAETARFALREGAVDIRQLVLTAPEDSLPPVSVPHGSVEGIAFDYPRRALTIGAIRVEGGSLRTAYLADGTMTIQDLLTPVPDPRDTAPSSITVNIKKFATKGVSFTFIDRMLEPEAPFTLEDLTLSVENFTYGTRGTARLAATAVPNGAGSVRATGTISMEPQKADLDIHVAGMPLPSFQPYAARYSRAQLVDGTVSLNGKINYAAQGKRTVFRYRGTASSDRGRITDPVLKQDLTRWARLDMRRLEYTLDPPALSINEIVASRPYLRVIVGPDRRLNIQHAMATEGDSGSTPAGAPDSSGGTSSTELPGRVTHVPKDSAAATPVVKDSTTVSPVRTYPAASAAVRKDSAAATLTTINTITVTDGSMNFADLSLTPSFSTGIQSLNGTIRGLSSLQLARADVDLSGKVDTYAPVTIKGQINPLSEEAYTDILMKFEGMDLTTYSPYFTKFAGYRIDRGKLTLDLRYKLNKRHLDAENKIVINQLTLGEKVDGPDVTSLPVKLCIALLKDSKGDIDMDIPVSGSIDDPDFSFFPIILKAVLNLLWKIVTAPFALIGALFGGGENLDHVGFEPGLDTLSQGQAAKLATIAKGLTERPGLHLDIRGTSSDSLDGRVLALEALLRKVRPSGDGPWTRQEEERMLEIYKQSFGADAAQLVPGEESETRKQQIIEAARQRLATSMPPSENTLRELARRRAESVMRIVTTQHGIDPARLFLQEVKSNAAPVDGLVPTELSLTAP
jgi:hypothetical protein